ncbi:AAA family ATPase [Thiopseudomonas denitrificans]|nr:zeta toxin family protein [Thiopseudomonas denitrificans]
MTTDETRLQQEALAWARRNKKSFGRAQTNREKFPPEKKPVTIFMAGSPGAGKTEVSESLAEILAQDKGDSVLLVDPDQYRTRFESYDGSNSWIFQPAVSVLVEKVFDLALKQKQSFILDGTLSNFQKASHNIERCLGRGREVLILYVYQDPFLAWQFVQAREAMEGRRILKEHFIEQYFAAREAVNCLKANFGSQITVDLVVKNMDNGLQFYQGNVDSIDHHVPERYTLEALTLQLP